MLLPSRRPHRPPMCHRHRSKLLRLRLAKRERDPRAPQASPVHSRRQQAISSRLW